MAFLGCSTCAESPANHVASICIELTLAPLIVLLLYCRFRYHQLSLPTMFTVIRPPRLLTCLNMNVPTPSSWRNEAFLQRLVGRACPRSILRAEGIYIESRRACSKAEVTCCSETAEALLASSAHPRQWLWSRCTNASSLQSLAAPSSQPMMCMRLVRQSS